MDTQTLFQGFSHVLKEQITNATIKSIVSYVPLCLYETITWRVTV